jgi:hypothetical protein
MILLTFTEKINMFASKYYTYEVRMGLNINSEVSGADCLIYLRQVGIIVDFVDDRVFRGVLGPAYGSKISSIILTI